MAELTPKLIKRSKWRSFMDVGEASVPSLSLMGEGFTQLEESKNPVEYSRKYVHEDSERTDVVGFAPSVAYAVDAHSDSAVIAKIIKAHEQELTMEDAHVNIVSVNLFEEGVTEGSCVAYKRTYAIIPDSKAGDNALTYSGTFKCVSEKIKGEFAIATSIFTPDA